jgi:hypothetical protein
MSRNAVKSATRSRRQRNRGLPFKGSDAGGTIEKRAATNMSTPVAAIICCLATAAPSTPGGSVARHGLPKGNPSALRSLNNHGSCCRCRPDSALQVDLSPVATNMGLTASFRLSRCVNVAAAHQRFHQ